MEMLLEPSQAQMNGQWKRHSGRERGEHIDLRLTKDKDTCARKKGWSNCSHQPWLLNQALESGSHAHSAQLYCSDFTEFQVKDARGFKSLN